MHLYRGELDRKAKKQMRTSADYDPCESDVVVGGRMADLYYIILKRSNWEFKKS